jgi:predicted phage terminase large subunit-like protein
MNNYSKDILERVVSDRDVRREVTRESHSYFLPIYLSDYIKYESAPFHREMIDLTERTEQKLTAIVAFRGSGKSTIFSLSYPIWAILGKQNKKFILIISQTQIKAKQMLHNIKTELERNQLLKEDLGPFEEPKDEWQSSSIVIPKYDARIMVLSTDQSMRGIRHKSHRPDLIICDDIEDIASTKTQESRDKTFDWFTSEIIPAGDMDTKIIIIGNLVHDDSLMMRIREKIENKEIEGVFKAYPIINTDGKCLWEEKFSTPKSVEKLRKEVISPQAWEREYLLRIIPDDSQIIDPLWIRRYFDLPRNAHALGIYVGVDLAISKDHRADYTAIVPVMVYEKDSKLFLYILPEIVHERLNFMETRHQIKYINLTLESKYKITPKFIIEKVAYQDAIIQQLDEDNIDVDGVAPFGSKRERLQLTVPALSGKQIFFPNNNSKELIQELVHFGSEKHDDLADAFSLVVLDILVNKKPRKKGILLG